MFDTISTQRPPSMWCQDSISFLWKGKNAHATSDPHPSCNQKCLLWKLLPYLSLPQHYCVFVLLGFFFLLQKHFYEEAYTFLSVFFVLIVSSQVGHWEFGIAWFYTVSNTVAVFCLNMLKHLLLILSFSWCLYCIIYFSMFNSVCIFFLLFPAALDFLNSQNSD